MDMDTDLLTGIIDELQRKEDDTENICQLLQAKGLDHLPLETDVLVTEPKNSLYSETWSMIFAEDKVNSLKVLLPPKLPTNFAVDLFMNGYRMKAKNCMMYLLGQVPTMIHANVPINEYNKPTLLRFALDQDTYIRFMEQNIHTSTQERVQLLDMFLEENSSTGKTLLEQATPAACVGETLSTFYFYSSHSEPSAHVAHATEILTKRYKEEARRYRDNHGASLLHILLHYYRILKIHPEDIISSTKQLLSVGIDPTLQNNYGTTALDIIITKIFSDVRRPKDFTDIPIYITRIEACLECLKIMLSWSTGMKVEFNIPKLKPNYPSGEAFSQDLFQLWHVLLYNDIFHVNHMNDEGRIRNILENGLLEYNSLCQPAAELLYSAMCKGLCFCNPEEFSPSSLPYTIIENINLSAWRDRKLHCCNDRPAGEFKAPCYCCNWALLELVLHMKPGLVKPDNIHSEESIYHEICAYIDLVINWRYGGPINTENISKLVNITWMYFPPSKPIIMEKLHTLEEILSDSAGQRVIQELQELVRSVRPLQLLTRLCILQNIQWKHIQQLPLPGSLRRYIEIGDISSNHAIHELN